MKMRDKYNLGRKKRWMTLALASCVLFQIPNLITYAYNQTRSRQESSVVGEMNKTKSLDGIIEDTIENNERISRYRVIDDYKLKYLVKSMIEIESKGNKNAVSGQGAVGLMQLMPQTVDILNKKLGKSYSPKDMKKPELNIYYGIHHFLDKYNEYKDKKGDRVKFAVAGYIGVPKRIKNNRIKTWDDAVRSINYWPHDRHGTNAKMYVDKVMKGYKKYMQENKEYQVVKLNRLHQKIP